MNLQIFLPVYANCIAGFGNDGTHMKKSTNTIYNFLPFFQWGRIIFL